MIESLFSESETNQNNKPKNILWRAKAGYVLDSSGKDLLFLAIPFYCPKDKYHEIKHNFAAKALTQMWCPKGVFE